MKVGQIIKLIEGDGWAYHHSTGSHHHYKHPSKPGKVTIAGKPSYDLPPKTEKSILKQAGL